MKKIVADSNFKGGRLFTWKPTRRDMYVLKLCSKVGVEVVGSSDGRQRTYDVRTWSASWAETFRGGGVKTFQEVLERHELIAL